MVQLQLNVSSPQELNNIPHIKECFELAYILNSLLSTARYLINISQDDDSVLTESDTNYAFIYHTSNIYEATIRVKNICNNLNGVALNDSLSDIMRWLENETINKKSFYNTTLHDIRNKLGFHYTNIITINSIKESTTSYPPIFAAATGDKLTDSTFPIVDEIILKWMAGLTDKGESERDKRKIIMHEITDFSNNIYQLIFELLKLLLKDKLTPNDTNNNPQEHPL